MISGGNNGNSTNTGMQFEIQTCLNTTLSNKYTIQKSNELIDTATGECQQIFSVPKNKMYIFLKKSFGLNWKEVLDSRICGDEVVINLNTKKAYVIEKKNQKVSGSVDEKIQTGPFKKEELQKIFHPLGFEVEYIYLLSDWFKQKKYKSNLEYLKKHKIDVFFKEIPNFKLNEMLLISKKEEPSTFFNKRFFQTI